MALNKTKQKVEVASHTNWMGGESFDIKNPLTKLRIAASSCFFGEPQYYHQEKGTKLKIAGPIARLNDRDMKHLRETLDALDPQEWRNLSLAQLMEKTIDEALSFNPEATLQEAVRLRKEEHMRTTPQVILVRAAHHTKVKGTKLVRTYGAEILQRADEPATGLSYHLQAFGEKTPVPNALKRAWADALSRFKEYELAKYRTESRVVKLVDVVNLVHPKGDAINKLMKGKLTNEDNTWEAIISKEGSNKESWSKALDVMGHMAMLRNVRNLIQKGVDTKLFLNKLVAGAEKGKQLPFRYVSAYNAIKGQSGNVEDAIEDCLKLSLGNLPFFQGKLMALCDNSGSAQGSTTSSMGTMKVSTIANLTGILAAMRSDEGHLGVFGDKLETFSVRKNSSVFDQLNQAEKIAGGIGQATENGIWLFLNKAIERKEHWDNIFVFSDMQAGHGGLYGVDPRAYAKYQWHGHHLDVAKLVKEYRAKVNSKVNVFLVQVAGYQDTIIPEFYNRTYILGGWGEGLLRFAAEMSGLMRT